MKLIVSDDIAQEILTTDQNNLVHPYGALLKNEQDVELLQRLAT